MILPSAPGRGSLLSISNNLECVIHGTMRICAVEDTADLTAADHRQRIYAVFLVGDGPGDALGAFRVGGG